MSAPAMRFLQEKLGPTCRLTIVAGERNQRLARFLFPQATILVFPKAPFLRPFLFMRLWLGRYDVTVDLHSCPFSTTSGLMTLASGSPTRVGFWAGKSVQEFNGISRRVFNLGLNPPSDDHHERENGFLLAERLFPGVKRPTFHLPALPADVAKRVSGFYRTLGKGPGTRILGIHPTLRQGDPGWSRGKYVELTKKLGRFKDLKVVVVHGLGEGEELALFRKELGDAPGVFVLPENDVLFILGAARFFDGFVSNNTGTMHLGAWVTRSFAIFGPGNLRRWFPVGSGHGKPFVFRGPHGRPDSVPVQQVFQAIQKCLNLAVKTRRPGGRG